MRDHTPTPWKASPYSSIVGIAISAQPDPNKNTVVLAGTMGTFSDDHQVESEANAAFIVRAVNNHEALVDALERCLAFAEDVEVKALVGDEGCLWPAEIARAALAAAKGEAS